MRTLAYIPCLYGIDYLHYAIKSIESNVDTILILYTAKPSFGYATDKVCPETREQLYSIATAASPKVQWIDIEAGQEAAHREIAYKYAAGYDLILAVDTDEVWEEDSLKIALETALAGTARYYNIAGFLNFWKSFNRVCVDGFTPTRIIKCSVHNEQQQVISGTIYHFSCAQNKAIMDYKYLIHGHRDEIRAGWLQNVYYGWTPETRHLHPVTTDVWGEALEFDKTKLPEVLKNHPYYNVEVIS